MVAYFVLLSVPMILSLPSTASKKRWHAFLLTGVLAVYLIFVGLRDHVGTDWGNYVGYHYKNLYMSFGEALVSYEPGFALLNWLVSKLGWGIYGLNFFSALVFNIGLFSYAGRCVNPWLAVATVTPYLVIVIAMSACRQAMAIGVFFFMLAHWERMGGALKVTLVLLASSFHSSAIVLMAFIVYDVKLTLAARYSLLAAFARYVLLVGFAGLALIYLPATERFRYFQEGYLLQDIQSPGALLHMSLNALPAILYFVFRDRLRQVVGTSRILEALCLLSIVLLPATLISSTAVDRLALYFSAVQMTVLSALPSIARFRAQGLLIKLAVLVYSSLILLIWLGYSNHAVSYIPYANLLSTSSLLGF